MNSSREVAEPAGDGRVAGGLTPGIVERFFTEGPREDAYSISFDEVAGTIPSHVRGRYYVNGPAKFRRNGLQYNHWLDGDGMVACLAFGDKSIDFSCRYVQTQKFRDEEQAQKPLYRTFGTRYPDDRLRRGITLESPSNVSVYPCNGTLLAFGEQSLPMQMDPETLETLGIWTFDGQLTELSPFSAHPKFDERTGELSNFGISFAGREPVLNFYRFRADGSLAYRTRQAIDHPCSVHDFCITEKYAVICLSPYLLDFERMTKRNFTIQESLQWSPELPTVLLVLSRDDGRVVQEVETDLAFCLHTINGYECDGRLVVDLIEMDQPVYPQYQPLDQLLCEVPPARPVRLTIDVTTGTQRERLDFNGFECADFPAIDSRQQMLPTSHFWALGMSNPAASGPKLYDQLGHLTWELQQTDMFTTRPGQFCGAEPVFVPASDSSTEGTLICQLIDVENGRSSFALFDASNVSQGPIAEIPLRSPLHFGFHASFDTDHRDQKTLS